MLILDLWDISFHAVVVFGLGKNLLFKSILGRCACMYDIVMVSNKNLPFEPFSAHSSWVAVAFLALISK